MKRSLCAAAAVACAGTVCSAQSWNFVINGQQQVPSNLELGVGSGTVTYHPSTDVLSWEIMWSGLTGSPTAMHFHIGAPGVNGPHGVHIHTFTLAAAGSASGAETALTPAFVNALFAGNVYVNIHTLAYPGGEIRGQVVPSPAAAALLGLGLLASARRSR
ncbi:MAG TPA: CHRD domain-containing protein [Phycisphaerales bacterium]|nr:CHRD domain-containing protein [Phycisphaerales bacterium]